MGRRNASLSSVKLDGKLFSQNVSLLGTLLVIITKYIRHLIFYIRIVFSFLVRYLFKLLDRWHFLHSFGHSDPIRPIPCHWHHHHHQIVGIYIKMSLISQIPTMCVMMTECCIAFQSICIPMSNSSAKAAFFHMANQAFHKNC